MGPAKTRPKKATRSATLIASDLSSTLDIPARTNPRASSPNRGAGDLDNATATIPTRKPIAFTKGLTDWSKPGERATTSEAIVFSTVPRNFASVRSSHFLLELAGVAMIACGERSHAGISDDGLPGFKS